MKKLRRSKRVMKIAVASGAVCLIASGFTTATGSGRCSDLPSHAELKKALRASVFGGPSGNGSAGSTNGGFDLDMWATTVNRDGEVCAVVFSGNNRGDQWPGSRNISAQKANTANAFSLPGLALSTANLYSAVQPGGSLFGLQHSNPIVGELAYGNRPTVGGDGNARRYGQSNDPMTGGIIGGVNVFGGGLALYADGGRLLGAVGVSGDSSCADHNIAWRVRDTLGLDYVPGGVGVPEGTDNIVYDIRNDAGSNPESRSGWGHPACTNRRDDRTINSGIVDQCPIGDGTSNGCLH